MQNAPNITPPFDDFSCGGTDILAHPRYQEILSDLRCQEMMNGVEYALFIGTVWFKTPKSDADFKFRWK